MGGRTVTISVGGLKMANGADECEFLSFSRPKTNGANQCDALTFSPSQRFSQFIKLFECDEGKERGHHQRWRLQTRRCWIWNLALARSCENRWHVRQPRRRLMIAVCQLMCGVVGSRTEAEGGWNTGYWRRYGRCSDGSILLSWLCGRENK